MTYIVQNPVDPNYVQLEQPVNTPVNPILSTASAQAPSAVISEPNQPPAGYPYHDYMQQVVQPPAQAPLEVMQVPAQAPEVISHPVVSAPPTQHVIQSGELSAVPHHILRYPPPTHLPPPNSLPPPSSSTQMIVQPPSPPPPIEVCVRIGLSDRKSVV